MNVHTVNCQSALDISDRSVERLVQSFLSWKDVTCDEVVIHLVSQKEICQLHEEYFQDPTPTDCISFPIDAPDEEADGYSILGEVFVCPAVALAYVSENGGNPYRETSLYIVHGLLHLLGYDDQDEEDRLIMRAQEKSAMLYLEGNKEILDAV